MLKENVTIFNAYILLPGLIFTQPPPLHGLPIVRISRATGENVRLPRLPCWLLLPQPGHYNSDGLSRRQLLSAGE